MTSKHWIKMVCGMLMIFVVSMMVIGFVRDKTSRASEVVVAAAADVGRQLAAQVVPVDGYAFLMDGKPVGALEKLEVRRSTRQVLSGYQYVVRLDDSVSVQRFASCHLVPVTPGEVTATSDWRCIHPQEPGYDQLKQFGNIVFQPSGQRHLLMVPADFLAQVQQIEGKDVTTVLRRDGFQLTINGVTVVNVQGSAEGGSLTVTDPATGETVVQVAGSREGGQVTVNSKRP